MEEREIGVVAPLPITNVVVATAPLLLVIVVHVRPLFPFSKLHGKCTFSLS